MAVHLAAGPEQRLAVLDQLRRSRGHTSTIVPATPAGTEFIIFITSMMQTIVSG